jgi:hypothetical protein
MRSSTFLYSTGAAELAEATQGGDQCKYTPSQKAISNPLRDKLSLGGGVDRGHSDTEDEESQYASLPYAPAALEGISKVALLVEVP